GRVMPFWYALTLLLSVAVVVLARTAWTLSWWLALGAAALFALMIVYTVLLPVPINNQVARWRPEALPANWRPLRRRWDTLHAIRVGVLLVALVLLVTSFIVHPIAPVGVAP
ncbi:MAG TPA: anthrone oxygenase family protein, partial [Chthoniobacterales bacterium]